MANTYVIADLHGRIDILEAALALIEADATGGKVVFTGDYVDRGPSSKQVLDRVMAGPTTDGWKWVCLKGNHEDMMVWAVRDKQDPNTWLGNGGVQTLQSFDGEPMGGYVDWAAGLPLYHTDKHRIYVHAGVEASTPMAEQTEAMLLWSRVPKHFDVRHRDGYIVHGHTAFEDGPVLTENRCNLDTAAVWTGRLAVAVFDDDIPGAPVKMMSVHCPSWRDLPVASFAEAGTNVPTGIMTIRRAA